MKYIKVVIIIHFVIWFLFEVMNAYRMGADFQENGKPIPPVGERLLNSIELFLWEFTLVPTLIGSILAGLVYGPPTKQQ